jgi:hypothetical protein
LKYVTKESLRCTRLAAASDKVYQLLAHSRWFSPGTPASSTTKTGRHEIAESGIKHQKSNQSFQGEKVLFYFNKVVGNIYLNQRRPDVISQLALFKCKLTVKHFFLNNLKPI